MRTRVVIDAPSNLGLRPPAPGTVPGCYKLAGALREQGIVRRLRALEGGVVVPPRYDRGDWQEGDGVFNAAAIARYTRTLADRIEHHVRAGEFPVVLGGDCSIQLGATLALRRIGRYGLAAVDGSADFRHPGNSDRIGAAGGEELALSTGRGQADLTGLEGLGPYLKDEDIRLFGMRDYDEDRAEMAALKISNATVGEIREWGPADIARAAVLSLEAPVLDGFWVHLDADVLDPSVMPAVDSPDEGGLFPGELTTLLRTLVGSPRCVGLNVTIYDPDLDPDASAGALLTDIVVDAFAEEGEEGQYGERR
ncbi:arginase family protein [Streptomyces sp. NBC_00059]|uniref:arginase family protein n=1 Tax=Streptomyces sp. NBC_00059 TaxID=2975635 RepID=UPI00224FC2E5|nr:arginase family protein [Streptomyces sp. NBC_00059]MCX5415187.1 arginase family protein [Streptomyces sp. NBC_00059]